jgi:hypothetical protein
MRRLLACLTLASIGTFATTAIAGAAVTPKGKSTTLRVYGVNGFSSFTTAAGKPLGENATPGPGDVLQNSTTLYHGSNTHHTKTSFATVWQHCVVISVSQTSLPANCEIVVAIGGSMIISQSVLNFASNSSTIVFPVTTGTGVYNGATGRIVVVNLGNPSTSTTSNATIEVTTP